MGDYIEVDTTTLGTDISEMETVLTSLRNEMTLAFDSVKELDGMWHGPANQAFNQQFENDKLIFDEVCEAVEGIIESMKNAKDAYDKCEAAVSEQINSIRI